MHLMKFFIWPLNKLGMAPSAGVPWSVSSATSAQSVPPLRRTFILISSLSCRIRLNSCTSCCMNESSDFQPKDLVSSVVPVDELCTFEPRAQLTDRVLRCLEMIENALQSQR